MIPRGQILGRLRDANYALYKKTKRVELYRKRGAGPVYVPVPIRDHFTVEEASAILKQAKLTPVEIEGFVKGCIKTNPS